MLEAKITERKWADFYRLYSAEFKQDVAVYLDLVAKQPGSVLEVGCGTGRVAGHLAAAGFRVHGIDTSRPMLEIARRHLAPWAGRASIADFDLRSGPAQERFEVALVSLYTFNRLIDVEEQRLFLRHLTRSLAPGAVVAFDMFCPAAMVRPEEAGEWQVIEHEVEGRRLHVRDRREMLTPLLERRTQVFRIDADSDSEIVTHRRYLPPLQAAALFGEAGLEDAQYVRGYDTSTAGPVSDEPPGGPYMLILRG